MNAHSHLIGGFIRRHMPAAAMILGLATAASIAHAGTIQQDQRSGVFQVQFYSPIAQSFTAVDPGLSSIGFVVSAINAHFPRVELGVRLHEGDGTDGAVLGTRIALPPPPANFNQYYDWDFSGMTLQPGHVYTAELFTSNPYWGVDAAFADVTDPYTGGRTYSNGHAGLSFINEVRQADLRFRVIGSPVPEPASAAYLLMGLAAVGLTVGRRASVQPNR